MDNWISVNDRLPKEDTSVLVVSKYHDKKRTVEISRLSLINGGWMNLNTHGYKVTHWMPIPEPPEGEQI